MNAPQGNIQFTGEFLNASGGGGLTNGELQYSFLSGILQGETGMFYFFASQYCCTGAPFGGLNHLPANEFTLWGNNWDISASNGLNSRQAVPGSTPLGIDIAGGNYTATPEPSSMLLLGSGLAGLLYWRKKQIHQVE
ncbi:MAG: hypothetical protein NPIRA04_26130 [Nitrospirales bacterium]|nr:MAG: hypothetical protein NPIRA04_26130 [Nitrospirales bacterium]